MIEEEVVLQTLGKSTSYMERTHLTMRHFNGRLARKTLAFSKVLRMYQGFRRLGRPLLLPGAFSENLTTQSARRSKTAMATPHTRNGC